MLNENLNLYKITVFGFFLVPLHLNSSLCKGKIKCYKHPFRIRISSVRNHTQLCGSSNNLF